MLIRWFPLYDVDDPPAGGGAAGADDDDRRDTPPDGERPKPSDLLARYGRDGDAALKMAEKLSEREDANYKLREKNRQLRDEVSTLRGKAAPDGAVVLSADEAARWKAYQELGAEPPVLKAALTERDEAKARLTTLERDALLRDVAAIGNGTTPYKLAVLKQIAGDLPFEIRDTTTDGKTVKAVFVKGQDGQVKGVAEYEQGEWADWLPALHAEPQQQSAQGTAYVAQSSGGKPAPTSMVDSFLAQQEAQRKAGRNPLMPH